jgi:putative membrane protein
MMWNQYDQFSWWWYVVMPLGMLGFWSLVAWVVVTIVRANRPTPTPSADVTNILAERYARGEIDADEYHRRLDDLHATSTERGGRS